MNIFDKFLEEWDLEIVWTVLLAAICVIGVTLVIPEDAGAGTAKPQNAEGLRADADRSTLGAPQLGQSPVLLSGRCQRS